MLRRNLRPTFRASQVFQNHGCTNSEEIEARGMTGPRKHHLQTPSASRDLHFCRLQSRIVLTQQSSLQTQAPSHRLLTSYYDLLLLSISTASCATSSAAFRLYSCGYVLSHSTQFLHLQDHAQSCSPAHLRYRLSSRTLSPTRQPWTSSNSYE